MQILNHSRLTVGSFWSMPGLGSTKMITALRKNDSSESESCQLTLFRMAFISL